MPKFPWNGWAYAWGRKRGDAENLVKDVKQDIEQEARQDIGQEQKAETSQTNTAVLFSYNTKTGNGPDYIFVHSTVSVTQNNASETSQQQTAGQEAEQKADNEFAVEQQAGTGLSYPNDSVWG
ncbi:hypothetical protein GCM10010964_07110 [Caldovatus sediminis]|uniref:Uncharacterized protein n=1 Tax=Caldovatus sediminis TaxID=2041189 RepID=A0A8J3EA30_9PROT|nr:hypothetical protein [Caldovatus sediminis]GGG21485.1 hypothetical protein GCM10010964_07110 [Caldovatus sediminis]